MQQKSSPRQALVASSWSRRNMTGRFVRVAWQWLRPASTLFGCRETRLLSMLLYALVARPSWFRHRRGVWWINNTAALMALIRDRSDSPDLSRLAQLIHVGFFCLNTWVYFEWVPSKSNWSDAISREGEADSWHRKNGFSTSFCFFPHELWDLPFRTLIATFEFL